MAIHQISSWPSLLRSTGWLLPGINILFGSVCIKHRRNTRYKSDGRSGCLCHSSQYFAYIPISPPAAATEMSLSALLHARPDSCVFVGMYFILLSCRSLDGCPVFWKEISSAKPFAFQASCKMHLPGHLSAKGGVVMANVSVKGNWQAGTLKHVLCLAYPFLRLWSCRACKCCPAIGHCVLTNFISTNLAEIISVMLKVLE